MELLSLLNDATIAHYGQTFSVALDWIGEIIKWLISGIGIVGIGIIVFSLILKCIVLPFDIFQRVSMRKQNQKMQENKEKLEKLQKQYANDKQKYNEKMMEFYKANGVSMMSSCLPMILSIVIFFVAIGAFNSYSQYANIDNYNQMATSYNQTIEYYTAEISKDNLSYVDVNFEKTDVMEASKYMMFKDTDTDTDNDKFVYVYVAFDYTNYADDADDALKVAYAQNVVLGKEVVTDSDGAKRFVSDYFYKVNTQKAHDYLTSQNDADYLALYDPAQSNEESATANYVKNKAKAAVATTYSEKLANDKKMSFLWIKNIWQTDAVYKHPVLSYSDFSGGMGNEKFAVSGIGHGISIGDMGAFTRVYSSEAYDEITANLGAQKAEPNGFFILIVLSIGTILLQQIITMKTQKAQNQFSTVDGQGGSQQKMMLIIMTVMFAIFSFMYSSAFSIYMITSNIVSLGSMLLINKIVDTVMAKKETKAFKEKHTMKTYKNKK